MKEHQMDQDDYETLSRAVEMLRAAKAAGRPDGAVNIFDVDALEVLFKLAAEGLGTELLGQQNYRIIRQAIEGAQAAIAAGRQQDATAILAEANVVQAVYEIIRDGLEAHQRAMRMASLGVKGSA
jgi:hypothetical protein